MWGLPVRKGVVTTLCADRPVGCVDECGRWLQEDCIEGARGWSSLELTLGVVEAKHAMMVHTPAQSTNH